MKLRVASLLLALGFISAPVFAQGPPAGAGPGNNLAAQVAALSERVAKLEGNIVATDLAGTYSVVVLNTDMSGFRPATPGNPAEPAKITTSVIRAGLTLNADGTGNMNGNTVFPGCEGSTLLLTGAMRAADTSECEGGESGVTWTYDAGVITITFLSDGDQLTVSVALGGRLLTLAFSPFHPSDPSSNHALFIATRLK